jgi:hypothetical protein
MKITFIKKIFFSAILLVCTSAAGAQELINEDFLDNIETNAAALWSENIPEFAVTRVPDKYKEESAVVMGFKRSVTIDKKSRSGFLSRGERSLLFFENVRFKIKLNDRNAVQNFTEVYFRYSDKIDGFSARITKADGTVMNVSLNDAVEVEGIASVPEFFKSFFDQQSYSFHRYYKVAVPDLVPGDILEYVTITKSKLDVLGTGYIEFSPQYEICNKSYPVLFNQIIIETDNKSYFKSMSINGAPEFKKQTASDPEFFKYVFTDSDRGVEKDVNFINALKVYPLTKFQVIYANKEVKGALIGNVGEIKSSFSKDELAAKAWANYEEVGDSYYPDYGTVQKVVDLVWAEFKKQNAKYWDEKKYINNVYYRLRHIVLNRDSYLSDKVAAYIFGSLLFQRDIKSDVVITVPSSVTKLSNVLFDQEMRYVVKVGSNFYFNFTDHSNPGELVEDLLSSEAYIIAKPDKKSPVSITSVNLPDATPADNVADYVIDAELNADMTSLKISRVNTYKGISKNRNISSALAYTTYMLDDYEHYNGMAPTMYMSDYQRTEYHKSVKALKEEFKEAKPEQVKRELQKEYQQKVTYTGFTISKDGRSIKNQDLVFTEEFELQGMVRKAGKKYLVNIPGLVGSQLQIKKDERERKHDINVGYARSLSWVINFKIPAGYTVEGLTELNNTADNAAGTFSCKAEEKEGVVTLTISKVYKKANTARDQWPSMMAFIDAAYNNSFKYLLLKPKN